jgi:hypothetical protein
MGCVPAGCGGPEVSNSVENSFAARTENFPVKECQVCGELIPMTRRTARDWEQIQFCSAACRRNGHVPSPIAKAS